MFLVQYPLQARAGTNDSHIAAYAGAALRHDAVPADSSPPPFPLVALDIRGDTVDITRRYPDGDIYVIFYNDYSCRDCFPRIERVLREIRGADTSYHIIALIRTDGGVLGRRSALSGARKLLPDLQDFYFDCRETSDDDPWPPMNLRGGLFGRYGISKTPSLLLYFRDGAGRYLSYDDLEEQLALPPEQREKGLREVLGAAMRREPVRP